MQIFCCLSKQKKNIKRKEVKNPPFPKAGLALSPAKSNKSLNRPKSVVSREGSVLPKKREGFDNLCSERFRPFPLNSYSEGG